MNCSSLNRDLFILSVSFVGTDSTSNWRRKRTSGHKFQPNKKRSRENWTKVRFTPVAGRMIIFPAWLYHAVDPNETKETGDAGNRVIISFNLNQVKKS
nr:TIGR02466 family protein [Ruegeria pomeroyi]